MSENSESQVVASQRTRPAENQQNQGHPVESAKPGNGVRAVKKTLGISSKVLALDTIFKNAKYMKSRNANVWSDLFSRDGFQKAKQTFKNPRQHNPGNKVYASLALSIGLCLLMAAYSVTFIAGHPAPAQLPWINKVALVGCALYGFLGTLVYGSILWVKIKHRIRILANSQREQS